MLIAIYNDINVVGYWDFVKVSKIVSKFSEIDTNMVEETLIFSISTSYKETNCRKIYTIYFEEQVIAIKLLQKIIIN